LESRTVPVIRDVPVCADTMTIEIAARMSDRIRRVHVNMAFSWKLGRRAKVITFCYARCKQLLLRKR
jgi:hypothetical protein